MVKHSGKRPDHIFLFRPLRLYDINRISAWVNQMNPRYRFGKEKITGAFNRHYRDIWQSRWSRTWVMTIRGRLAFCLTLCTGLLHQKEGAPRPESGCDNQLYLLSSPQIRRSNRRLLLAWQAATVYIFLKM